MDSDKVPEQHLRSTLVGKLANLEPGQEVRVAFALRTVEGPLEMKVVQATLQDPNTIISKDGKYRFCIKKTSFTFNDVSQRLTLYGAPVFTLVEDPGEEIRITALVQAMNAERVRIVEAFTRAQEEFNRAEKAMTLKFARGFIQGDGQSSS